MFGVTFLIFIIGIILCATFFGFIVYCQKRLNQNRVLQLQSPNQNYHISVRNINPNYFDRYNNNNNNISQANYSYNSNNGMILHVKPNLNEPPSYEEAIRKL